MTNENAKTMKEKKAIPKVNSILFAPSKRMFNKMQ